MKLDKFIVDSNALITPFRQYYPFDLAGSFWNQMEDALKCENVILLDVVVSELTRFEDDLSDWLKSIDDLSITTVKTPEIIQRYGEVLIYLQESDRYQEAALRSWANMQVADPWLIAAAIETNAVIITDEKSAGPITAGHPSKNAKIPDVAEHFNVQCENLFYFMRKMNIRL